MDYHTEAIYKFDTFWERLKEVTGLKTQEAVGNELGYGQSRISQLKTSPPTTDLLIDIAHKYKCSIDYLLGISDTNETEPKLFEITKDLLLYCVLNEMRKNVAQDKIEIRQNGDSFIITISDECFKKEGIFFDATVSTYNSSKKLLKKMNKAEQKKFIIDTCYQNKIS